VLPYVISELQGKVKGMGFKEVKAAVEHYFSGIVWSMEKQEWSRMSEHLRNILVLKLMARANADCGTSIPSDHTDHGYPRKTSHHQAHLHSQDKPKTPSKNITH